MEFENIVMTDREDRLRLIIQHSLSASIRNSLTGVVLETECHRVHETLDKDREARGREMTEMRSDIKGFGVTLNKFFYAVIATLTTSLLALIFTMITYFTGHKP